MDWLNQAFGKYAEMSTGAFIAVIAIIAAGVVGIALYWRLSKKDSASKMRWTTKELTTAALCIGAAFLLSYIRLFKMPMGGSITPASMLPILAFAYIYGVKKGMLVGFVFSILQFIQEPIMLTPVQVLLDYFLAFSLLGLAGLAKKSIIPGIAYGCTARFLCSFLSGWIFFGMYAPEGMPAWLYSLGYNGAIIGVEMAVCMAVCFIPAFGKLLDRTKKAQQSRHALPPESPVTQKTA